MNRKSFHVIGYIKNTELLAIETYFNQSRRALFSIKVISPELVAYRVSLDTLDKYLSKQMKIDLLNKFIEQFHFRVKYLQKKKKHCYSQIPELNLFDKSSKLTTIKRLREKLNTNYSSLTENVKEPRAGISSFKMLFSKDKDDQRQIKKNSRLLARLHDSAGDTMSKSQQIFKRINSVKSNMDLDLFGRPLHPQLFVNSYSTKDLEIQAISKTVIELRDKFSKTFSVNDLKRKVVKRSDLALQLAKNLPKVEIAREPQISTTSQSLTQDAIAKITNCSMVQVFRKMSRTTDHRAVNADIKRTAMSFVIKSNISSTPSHSSAKRLLLTRPEGNYLNKGLQEPQIA